VAGSGTTVIFGPLTAFFWISAVVPDSLLAISELLNWSSTLVTPAPAKSEAMSMFTLPVHEKVPAGWRPTNSWFVWGPGVKVLAKSAPAPPKVMI
jgi:hypothetical protein